MAYETGTSTGPIDLLSKLQTRLNTDGWTITRSGGTPGNQLTIEDGSALLGTFFSFLPIETANVESWHCQPHTSDSGDVVFQSHPGSPNTSGSGATFIRFGQSNSSDVQGFEGASIAYHFFTGTVTNGRYCHVVLEGTSGIYFHLAFGTIEKVGVFDGGAYISATNFTDTAADAHWLFNFESGVNSGIDWLRNDDHYTSIGQTTDAGASRWFQKIAFAGSYGEVNNMYSGLYQGGLQAWNNRSTLCPIWIHTFNSLNPVPITTAFKIVGQIPDMRFISMDGRTADEIMTIGGDDWMIFPMHNKQTVHQDDDEAYDNTNLSGPPDNNTNLMGLAYRKNP